jgi:hypothetical protein
MVTKHQALIARSSCVHAHRDIRRLALERGNDSAGFRVKAVLGARVADITHHFASNVGIIQNCLGRNFARDHHEAGGHERFARYAPGRVFRKHRVEHSVGDLVGNFVRMAFGHRFRGKQKFAILVAQTSTSPE